MNQTNFEKWKTDFETRLRAVQWEKLNHAYGPAGDVPDLLVGLITPRGVGAEMYQLWGNLYHQGDRYQATLVALPFLVELLEQLPDERDELVLYLVCIALGEPAQHYPLGIRLSGESALNASDKVFYERVQTDAFPVFLRLAREANERGSNRALWALGWFPSHEAESRPVLEASNTPAAQFALEMLDNAKQPFRQRSEEEEERDFEEFEQRLGEI